ncbi:MAG: hypothetical protein J1E63_10625 [Muribaculaceae bacterium]|nr:hypothetical protein [Muribaculaceae bacterium]
MTYKPFTTKPFNLPTSVYARAALGGLFSRYAIAIGLPVLALLVAGLAVDLRLVIVAWMIPCVVLPMLLLLAYYNVMLHPAMRILAFTRVATLDADGNLTITPCRDEELQLLEKNKPGEYLDTRTRHVASLPAPDAPRPLPAPVHIPAADIESVTLSRRCYRFNLRRDAASTPLRYIFIPLDAIPD